MDTARLIMLIEEASGSKGVTLETRIEDLGIDSLEFLDILCMVEENFGIKVPKGKETEVVEVGDLLIYADVPSRII